MRVYVRACPVRARAYHRRPRGDLIVLCSHAYLTGRPFVLHWPAGTPPSRIQPSAQRRSGDAPALMRTRVCCAQEVHLESVMIFLDEQRCDII